MVEMRCEGETLLQTGRLPYTNDAHAPFPLNFLFQAVTGADLEAEAVSSGRQYCLKGTLFQMQGAMPFRNTHYRRTRRRKI
uniref:Uncharacterized protein n=1 Tax=Desulfovibrio desulfuricans (strain ATCC 27774 / DSM 6949 / MB) TaxID=525146 RepID=B8J461_DESDA